MEEQEFTRKSVINHLDQRGFSPVHPLYRERVEQYILFHYNIMEEELAEKKKFKSYCSGFACKVKDYYYANERLIDRMLDDDSHKVVSLHSVLNHLNQKVNVLISNHKSSLEGERKSAFKMDA